MSRPPADLRADRLRAALSVEGEDHCCDKCTDESQKQGRKVTCQDENLCSILPMPSDSVTKPLPESVRECVANLKESGEVDPNDPKALSRAYGSCAIKARGLVKDEASAKRLESILNERAPSRRRHRTRRQVAEQKRPEATHTPTRPAPTPVPADVTLPPVPRVKLTTPPAPRIVIDDVQHFVETCQTCGGESKCRCPSRVHAGVQVERRIVERCFDCQSAQPTSELRARSDAFKIAEAAKAFAQLDERSETLCEDTAATKRAYTSRPMRFFETRGMLAGDVLDYGSGRDPHDCARYDPVYAPKSDVLQRQWSTVTCNYVLDIVEQDGHRDALMLALKQLVKPHGRCLLSVRQPDDIAENMESPREQWGEFLSRFWPQVSQIEDDTPGFWAWELRHTAPSALTEQKQVEPARTKENITVGPFHINVPEREVKVEAPVSVQPAEITVNTPEVKPEVSVKPQIKVDVPKQPAPKVDVRVEAPEQKAPIVNIDEGAVQVNVEAPKAPTKTIQIQRDGKGGVTGTLSVKEDGEPDDMPEAMKRMLGK